MYKITSQTNQHNKVGINEINKIKVLSYISFNRCIRYYYKINFPIELSNIILSFICNQYNEEEYLISQNIIDSIQIEHIEHIKYVNKYIKQQQQKKQILLHDNDFCDLNFNCSQCVITSWEFWNNNCIL